LTIVILALIFLFASFVRAISGFGLALVATPLLVLVIEVKRAVVLSVIMSGISSLFVLVFMWRYIDFKRIAFVCLGAAIGIPLGAYFLSILSSITIKLVLASLAIPLAILLMLRVPYRFTRDWLGCVIAGFLGGALSATTGVPGPPIVLFLLNQGLVKEKFVGTCAAIFLFIPLATFGAHASLSLIDTEVLVQAVILIPALGVGTYIGEKVLSKLEPMLFKRIAAGIVVASATAILVNVTTSI